MRFVDRSAHTNRWRRIPCLEKLALAIGMMVAALTTTSWLAEGAILVVMVGLTLFGAHVAWRDLARAAAAPVGFVLVGTLAQAVSIRFGGTGPMFELTKEALLGACFIALRSLACIAALLSLALTTPLPDLLRLLRRVGLGRDVGDMALVMFRFIWLLLDCADRGRQSQLNRLGYAGYRRGFSSLGALMAALLPRALSRAQRLETGLLARGYDGDLRFISLEQPVSARRLGGIVLLLAAMIAVGATFP
jgi:cobalt/nickel transport system permease protein